jgi:hypothetical protein
MRSIWFILLFLCLLFAVQAYGAPVMAVGIAGDELPSLVANTNTASGVLGIGSTGNNGSNTPFTTTIPGGRSVAGVPTTTQVPAPVNPVGTTQNLQGNAGSTALNAPGVTTGVMGTGVPTAGAGSVSNAVTPFNTTSTATASNQGLTALSPGAGTGIPAASGGGSLTTAPALPITPTTTSGLAGVSGTGSVASTGAGLSTGIPAASGGGSLTTAPALPIPPNGGIPAPNLGQP